MNILMDSYPHYDYMIATISQGLQKLGHTVVGRYSNRHNYCQAEPTATYDLFIQCQAGFDPIPGMPSVMLWGEDAGMDWRRSLPKGFQAIFVRDYAGGGPAHVFPINFGVEERYLCIDRKIRKLGIRQRPIDIGFWGNIDTPSRIECCKAIRERFIHGYNIKLEGQVFNEPDIYWSRWTGTYRPHDPNYFAALANSKVLVSFAGHGPDCGRHWEILSAGAVCLIEDMGTILCPPAPVDSRHCFFFKTPAQLLGHISNILADPIQYQHIADNGRNAAQGVFATRSRAKYLLKTLVEIKVIKGGLL
jgi:hypothetical protein